MEYTKEPPFSEEAELGALGSMMMDQQAAELGKSLLAPDDFYRVGNRLFFESLCAVLGKGKAADMVTVSDQLKSKEQFEQVGGMVFMMTVANAVGNSIRLKEYANILREKSYFRRKIKAGQEMVSAGYQQDRESIQRLSLDTEKDTVGGGQFVAAEVAFQEFLMNLKTHKDSGKSILGFSTGFKKLDIMTSGLQEDNLIILAARPSMGKTTLATDFLQNSLAEVRKENKIALFFSLEMNRKAVMNRMFCAKYNFDNAKFSVLNQNEKEWNASMAFVARNLPHFYESLEGIFIDDRAGLTIAEMEMACHDIRVEQGKEIGLVVIDYLQIMGGKDSGNRAVDVGRNSLGAKNLSKKFHCPVVLLSQLSRSLEGRTDKRPILSDLRDSGSIEQDADIVLMLYRDEYYFPDTEKKNVAEVIIAKNRNGPTSMVELIFLGKNTTFRNMERVH